MRLVAGDGDGRKAGRAGRLKILKQALDPSLLARRIAPRIDGQGRRQPPKADAGDRSFCSLTIWDEEALWALGDCFELAGLGIERWFKPVDGSAIFKLESLILAQIERWRQA